MCLGHGSGERAARSAQILLALIPIVDFIVPGMDTPNPRFGYAHRSRIERNSGLHMCRYTYNVRRGRLLRRKLRTNGDYMSAKKFLVTGATGETGRYTVKELLERGHDVRALVRKEDERAERLRRAGAEVLSATCWNTTTSLPRAKE